MGKTCISKQETGAAMVQTTDTVFEDPPDHFILRQKIRRYWDCCEKDFQRGMICDTIAEILHIINTIEK